MFTILLLDCWQREYDKRPYRHFRFSRLEFEKRMQRRFHSVHDVLTIVEFLNKRCLCSAAITGIHLSSFENDTLLSFANSLLRLRRIELRLMRLPTKFFELLCERVEEMNLVELILDGTSLTTPDIEAVYNFIIQSRLLRLLSVSNCDVTQYDFPLLADGVHKSASIRSLICNRLIGKSVPLDTTKISHIVSALIWKNKLHELEMQKCELQARDMEIIAEYLTLPASKLRKLNLANNCIGPDGVEYILSALVASNTLTHLHIGGNSLGTIGGQNLAKYLSFCYLLVYLNITWNNICADSLNLILTALFKKPINLQRLEIYGNHFDAKSADILRQLVDAGVLAQERLDVISVYDESLSDYRVTRYD